MAAIDLQQFMQLRENARTRQQEPASRKSASVSGSTTATASDWKALLESKREALGLQKGAPTTAASAATSTVSATASRTTAADLSGTIEDRVEELRDRHSQGLSVRELGNFIDVRA